MSHGTDQGISWGFSSVIDWLHSVILSFPAPWSLAPLEGKYYGTEILDGRGVLILSFWDVTGDPSRREKDQYGANWSHEEWTANLCDCHWESELSLSVAEYVIATRNSMRHDIWWPEYKDLATIIVSIGRWHDDVFKELVCGGPNRRLAEPHSPRMRSMLHLDAR